MVPVSPTATNVLPPWETPKMDCEVPEVLDVQEVPSDEVRMVPSLPNVTNPSDFRFKPSEVPTL